MIFFEDILKYLKAGTRYRIVFLGDSITSTEWVHPNWREIVEYVLKEECTKVLHDWKIASWSIRCFNAGFDGSTTSDIHSLLDFEVLSLSPQLVVWMNTANDLHASIGAEEHVDNSKRIIDTIIQSGVRLLCATSIPTLNVNYNQRYSSLAEGFAKLFPIPDVVFIDIFKQYALFDLKRFYTFVSGGNEALEIAEGEIDFAHPNQLGNAYLAKLFLEDAFGIVFDPERYMHGTLIGEKYPKY